MSKEEDTEFLRERLRWPEFHEEYDQKWISVHDGNIMAFDNRDGLEAYLRLSGDKDKNIIVFVDNRVLV